MVQLLGLVAAAEVAVAGPSSLVGLVEGAAVPGVAVEDDDGAGGGEEEAFVGVSRFWVSAVVAGELGREVGARHRPGGSVIRSEVVEEPDGVADLVIAGGFEAAPVGVEGLEALAGEGEAGVQGGELEVAFEDVGDGGRTLGWV